MVQKYLIIILILLTIILYCQYYCNYHNDFKVTQTYLNKIDMNMLQEKYPIVIYDKVIEPKELLKTLFAYSYSISSDFPMIFNNKMFINLSKNIILYNQISDVNIDIIHPRHRSGIQFEESRNNRGLLQSKINLLDSNVEYVTLKLKKNQVLILPAFWLFSSLLPLQSIHIDDIMSYLVNITYKKLIKM